MTDQDTSPSEKTRNGNRGRSIAIAAIVLALAGGAYFVRGYNEAPKGGACPINNATEALKPLARGEVAAFSVADWPQDFPKIAFRGPDGREMTLADFRGRTVLVNLWATWCVPCRKEMPALDRLQAELGGGDFEVVAINVDTSGPEKPRKWLEDNDIRNLRFYTDNNGVVLKTLQRTGHVVGLPTTILITPEGCQSGILRGGAEWASEDAFRLLKAALGRKD